MKKVDIITFHSAENSGAALQCLALQETLKKMGADVKIINYQPDYLEEQYKIIINPFKYADRENYIKSFVAYMLQNIRFIRKLKRKNKFEKFRGKYFKLTKKYTSIEELRNNPPEADIYICGSDQIWNPALTGGDFDPAYFLQFGSKKTHKYSYAVSIGKELYDKEIKEICDLASELIAFSFRESSVYSGFNSAYHEKKIYHSVDPTLLLDNKDWEKYIRKDSVNSRYILVYALEKNELFQKEIEFIKLYDPQLLIMDISQCNLNIRGNVKRIMGFSPDEFLSYIYNAEYIITNSFHCTVFSIIFSKRFVTIKHSRSNTRLVDLLTRLDIENRFYADESETIFTSLDKNDIQIKIKKFREESIEYLEQILR